MAKRKRLSSARPDFLAPADPPPGLETKSAPLTPAPRAPIAQVAGEASVTSALTELAGEIQRAREEGRLIQALPLEAVEAGYLVRDRLMADDAELQVLIASLRARGQQTPIEVVDLGQGRFGLISGWRRLTALHALHAETGEARFGQIKALIRQPETAAEAYLAMVEENEIRVGLSYYERARVAAKAVEQGVFDSEKAALLTLYASASRAKRSKIRSFLPLYHAADDLLRFAPAITERLGLALAKWLEADTSRRAALRDALVGAGAEDAAAEIARLEALLAEAPPASSQNAGSEPETVSAPESAKDRDAAAERHPNRSIVPGLATPREGVVMRYGGRKITISGPDVTEDLRARLQDWLSRNA